MKSLETVSVPLSCGSHMNERGSCDIIGPVRGHFLVPPVSFLYRTVCKSAVFDASLASTVMAAVKFKKNSEISKTHKDFNCV